jgi:hypothetical protein
MTTPENPDILGVFPERRIHRRVHVQFEPQSVIYVELGDGRTGVITNISEGGLAIQTVSPLISDDLPDITFRLPPAVNLIRPTAQMMWKTVSKKMAGVRFLSMSLKESTELRSWINARLPQESRSQGAATLAAPADLKWEPRSSDRFDHLQQLQTERTPTQSVRSKWIQRAVAIIFTIVLVAYVIAFWHETPAGKLRTFSDWSTATFRSVRMPLLWAALAIFWIGVAFVIRGLLRMDPPVKK